MAKTASHHMETSSLSRGDLEVRRAEIQANLANPNPHRSVSWAEQIIPHWHRELSRVEAEIRWRDDLTAMSIACERIRMETLETVDAAPGESVTACALAGKAWGLMRAAATSWHHREAARTYGLAAGYAWLAREASEAERARSGLPPHPTVMRRRERRMRAREHARVEAT